MNMRHSTYLQGVGPNVISQFNNGLSVFFFRSSISLDRLPGVLLFEYCFHYYLIIYFLLYNLIEFYSNKFAKLLGLHRTLLPRLTLNKNGTKTAKTIQSTCSAINAIASRIN
jgi:hypothetical protein